jgi:predicted metal-dependent hydrolase
MLQALLQLSFDFFAGAPPTPKSGLVQLSEPPSPLKLPALQTPEILDGQQSNGLLTHPKANRAITLANQSLAYYFRRAKRRSIGFSVSSDGLTVSAPRWTLIHEVEAAIREKADWILRKLHEMKLREAKTGANAIEWREGGEILYLGQALRLRLTPSMPTRPTNPIHADEVVVGGELRVNLPQTASPEQIRDWVQAWLMKQAKHLFELRLHHFADPLGVKWTQFRLSSANTRWGSASADGSIRLNWRLIHHPLPIIDYVVAHELSHLRVMNHSPDFWQTVESVLPDYKARRRALKTEAIPHW